MDRRSVMLGFGAASLAALAVRADELKDSMDYLFVQTAPAAGLADGKLVLNGAAPDTLYFSDRPDRIVGHLSNEEFIKRWTEGDDSFKADPPNAALVVHDGDTTVEVVHTLRNPRMEGSDLVYDAAPLGDGPKRVAGSAAALFIDAMGMPQAPLSFAGAGPRAPRRVVTSGTD